MKSLKCEAMVQVHMSPNFSISLCHHIFILCSYDLRLSNRDLGQVWKIIPYLSIHQDRRIDETWPPRGTFSLEGVCLPWRGTPAFETSSHTVLIVSLLVFISYIREKKN